MSFEAKRKEWRKRIVHLLVFVLLCTSIPIVPVQAQTEASPVTELETGQESTSGGDAAPSVSMGDASEGVTVDESSTLSEEAEIVAINPVVARTTFFYEVDYISEYALVSSLELVDADGNTKECIPWSAEWQNHGFVCNVLDKEGNVAQQDASYKYPIGEYTFKICTSSGAASCEIPFEVVSLEENATYLSVGETVTGLAGTVNYGSDEYIDGHWLILEIDEPGQYKVSKSEVGVIRIKYPTGEDHSWMAVTESACFTVTEESVGTYYCYVKGCDTFDVSFAVVSSVTAISATISRDVFYHELEGYIYTSDIVSGLTLTLDDGTAVDCAGYWDESWNEYALNSRMYDKDGNDVLLDENGKYPIGEYTLKIYTSNGEGSCEIPYKVMSLEDAATELSIGGTVTGLTGTVNYNYYTYTGGHWFKLELSEVGNYEIQTSVESTLQLIASDGASVQSGNTSLYVSVDETMKGTYYLYAKGSDTFDMSLAKGTSITGLTASVKRDTFFYEVETAHILEAVSSIEIAFDDGEVESISWGSDWSGYGIQYSVLDKDGNDVQYGAYGKYPVGEYIFKLYVSGSDVSCEIPFEVVSLEETATELSTGETITGLTGTDVYVAAEYIGGHWFKLELSEAGIYEVRKSVGGLIDVTYPGYKSFRIYSDVFCMEVDETTTGTYYLYVKGNETFDVSLVKKADLTELKANVVRDTFFYEVERIELSNAVSTVDFVFADGEIESCDLYSYKWSGHGLTYNILDMDGNNAQMDASYKYPVGEYVIRIYSNNIEASVEIPVEVVSIEDEATELTVGDTVTDLSGTENCKELDYVDGHWIKFNITEAGNYELLLSQYGSLQLTKPDSDGMPTNWSYTKKASFQVTTAGTYYLYVKGSDTFDVSLVKKADITELKANVKRNTFYYEVEGISISNVISSVEAILENGETVTCTPWSTEWNDHSLTYDVLDKDGNYAKQDASYKYPVGEYVIKIYSIGGETSVEIPVEVVSVEDVATELVLGETLTGLSGTEMYNSSDYVNGHWVKFEVAEAGNYEITKSEYGRIRMITSVGGSYSWSNTKRASFQVSDAEVGTYFCYVKGRDNFDITVTRHPSIVAIQPNVNRDSFVYEFDYISLGSVISSLELTLDNGTVTTCDLYSDTWYTYGFQSTLLDSEGNTAQRDVNYRYPLGSYIYEIYTSDKTASCQIPIKVMNLTDVEEVLVAGEAVSLAQLYKYYKFNVSENGLYELQVVGENAGSCGVVLYREDGSVYRSTCRFGKGLEALGEISAGNYYVYLYGDAETLQINRKEDLVSINYSGEEIVFQYGEWGYKLEGDLSCNVSTRPEVPNSVLSGSYVSLPISFVGTTESGSEIDIPYKGYQWNAYICNLVFSNTDGSEIYTDYNGYITRGEYLMHVLAHGGVTLVIPFKVVGGPMEVDSLTYTGEIQKFKYGTWGYSVENQIGENQLSGNQIAGNQLSGNQVGGNQLSGNQVGGNQLSGNQVGGNQLSGNQVGGNQLSGNQLSGNQVGGNQLSGNQFNGNRFDGPAQVNTDLNQLAQGGNILGLEFSVTGENAAGDTDTISYGSQLWKQYKIKTYFYQLDGTPVYTDESGYIPVGSYVMKCVAYNGVTCEVPLEVSQDVEKVVEGQLSEAVEEMLDAAESLTDESLVNATMEEKENVVSQLLGRVEEIYLEQDISEIGIVIAEKALGLIEQLAEIEKQIEDLLSTSVKVEAQDTEAEAIELSIKNALLSVPAGENAEIRVSTAKMPANGNFDKTRARAIDVELFAGDEDKMSLRAPVIITMRIPEGIGEDEKIIVHHYKDGVAVETIPVVLHGDGTMSFATGSFSTFVIATEVDGLSVSGMASSFGDADEQVALKLLNAEGVCVFENTSSPDTGIFRFEDVEQGSYTLVAEKTNHTTREYSITVADTAVTQDVSIYLVGDVNGDGKINARDKRIIYNHIAGESVLTDYNFLVGDVNGDGKINARDKRMIYNHIAGKSLLW